MTKLTFTKRVLELDLYGTEVKLDFPTVGQYKKYVDRLNKKEDEIGIMTELLTELGMPSEKFNDLEPSHLKQIIETLVGEEKK